MADHPITPQQFLSHSSRRFGRANPERIDNPVWAWMVRTRFTPNRAREALGLEPDYLSPSKPEWCFTRMGAGRVKMPDGRSITIGGEHEDYYDPDFCIYNDVVVQKGDAIEIYAYPNEVFPPTDFHTATLVGDRIIIIGSLGYTEDRRPGTTPLFALDTRDYSISAFPTTGAHPGWIHEHSAALLGDGRTIEIKAGKVLRDREGDQKNAAFRRNFDTYRLDTSSGEWTQLTDHSSWRQFSMMCDEDHKKGPYASFGWHTGDILEKVGYPLQKAASPDHEDDDDNERESHIYADRFHTITIDGVDVRITHTFISIDLIVEGDLPDPTIKRLLADIRELAKMTHKNIGEFEEV